jgi:preprotein translocase subunit Sec61beta
MFSIGICDYGAVNMSSEKGLLDIYRRRACGNVQEEGFIRHFEEESSPKCPRKGVY